MRTCPPGPPRRMGRLSIVVRAAIVFVVVAAASAAASRSVPVDGSYHTPHDDVSAVALSPQFASDRTLFTIVRARLFRARDGGRKWERIGYGLGGAPLRDVAFSSTYETDRTLYVAAYDGPYRSIDGGDTWQRVGGTDAPVRLDAIHTCPSTRRAGALVVVDSDGHMARSDDAGATWSSDPAAPLVAALAWRAETDGVSDTLFVATIDGRCSTSNDGGATWVERGRLPEQIRASALSPADDGHSWWLGCEASGVWRVYGEPLEFECIDRELAGGRVNAVGQLGAGEQRTLFASTWRGGPQRFDAAANDFVAPPVPLETHAQAEKIQRPSFGEFAADGDDVFLATYCGLVHSRDRGRSWTELETLPIHLIMALDVVALDPRNVAIALSTYGAGVTISKDGGATWSTSTLGLDSARTMGVALSPEFGVDGRVVSGSYEVVLRSGDGGRRWTRFGIGVPTAKGASLADEDTQPSPVLVAFSPAFRTDRTIFAALHPNGFVRSRDGGATFPRVGAGLDEWPSALAVSPAFERDRTVFVATRAGLYVSKDAGGRFEALQSERSFRNCFLALSPNFAVDGVVFAGGVEGLRVSRDGGRTFTGVDLVPGDAPERVAGIAVAPTFATSREFLVQMRGGDLFVCRDEPNGIVSDVSSVGGDGLEFCALASFVREVDPLIAYSPNYERDRTIWASDSLGLFASTDGGRTFSGVARSTRLEAHQLRVDGAWSKIRRPGLQPVMRSSFGGSRVSASFVGTGASWVGSRGPTMGSATVRIDGEIVASVDLFAPAEEHGVVLHTVDGLASGPHEFAVVVTERAAAEGQTRPSTDPRGFVDVEAFEIHLAP